MSFSLTPSSSSSSSSFKRYDVFISFRGEDTPLDFTSHLHKALCNKQIVTYIDYQLRKGDEIWKTLCKAIEDSHISLVIFSEDYANSKWCLQELVKIMECRKDQGQVVIPVFYKVKPSDIRKQKGSYGEAFAKYERDLSDNESKNTVLKWREALREAAKVAGWHSESPGYRDEAGFIKKIVDDVHDKLSLLLSPYAMKGLVGMEEDCERVESLLEKSRTIGIWSMGGLGKTTLAKLLFAKLFPQFDVVCFLENVREDSKMHGISHLGEKLIFELLKNNVTTSDAIGSPLFKRRLERTKALVVLDDVDHIAQLEYLYSICGEVGQDSRLIITTRDRQLLIAGRADEIYKLKKRNFQDSLKIFSLRAFNQSRPIEGYEALSERAVHYAHGVPLALKVLGSHLNSRSKEFWECELGKLEKYPKCDIVDVLKLSYDGLDVTEKAIFLDIAFFFKNQHKDHAIMILDACDFDATSGISVLEDKALISISHFETIKMHDLIQEMGLEIGRREDFLPGGRSRLRDIEEVCDVLENNYGTLKVEGMILDLSQIEDLRLTANSFNGMPKLRFLNFYVPRGKKPGNVYLPSVLKPFSNELRYIKWNGYPSKSLPPAFCTKFLVAFRMPYSNLQTLWEGVQDLKNLRRIDLRECKHLKELPDLSCALSLEWVNLAGCENLRCLHPSISSLDSLVVLILDRCVKLRGLVSLKHLSSLRQLSVNGCSNLKDFSVPSDKIVKLHFSMTGVEMLRSSRSPGLGLRTKWLNVEGLEQKSLEYFEELWVSGSREKINKQKPHIQCNNLSELPDNTNLLSILHGLNLDGSSIESLPANFKHLQRLEFLSLRSCTKLECLPELPPSIKELDADNCTSLVTISTLKTFTVETKGREKFFSFKNGLKMDERSVNCIVEDGHLTMVRAVFHNVLLRRYGVQPHDPTYTGARFCFPGSRTPRQFTYRATQSSVDVLLPSQPNLLGFFLSVVLSPSFAIKRHGADIECKCYLADGTMEGGIGTTWDDQGAANVRSDHVFVWYDPYFCDRILKIYERQVSFKFDVIPHSGLPVESTVIKECGVCLLHASEFHSFLGELELDLDKKVDIGVKLGLALDMEQRLPMEVERNLLNALKDGSELQADEKLEYESRRKAILLATEGEMITPDETQEPSQQSSSDGIVGMQLDFVVVPQQLQLSSLPLITSSSHDDSLPSGVALHGGNVNLDMPDESVNPFVHSEGIELDAHKGDSGLDLDDTMSIRDLPNLEVQLIPDLANLLSVEDALLLSEFAQKHHDFLLSETVYPTVFRQLAYKQFAIFLKLLHSHKVAELLGPLKITAIEQLEALRYLHFHGDWLDDVQHRLSCQLPDVVSDEDYHKIVNAEIDYSQRIVNLNNEITELSTSIANLNTEIAKLNTRLGMLHSSMMEAKTELTHIRAEKKAIEESRAALDAPFDV